MSSYTGAMSESHVSDNSESIECDTEVIGGHFCWNHHESAS